MQLRARDVLLLLAAELRAPTAPESFEEKLFVLEADVAIFPQSRLACVCLLPECQAYLLEQRSSV